MQSDWKTSYGPWAVITGASDGIGREFARSLAARGLNVVLVARRREALDVLAAELQTQHGVTALVVSADLGQQGGIDAVRAATSALEVGLLVAAAGFGTSGDFLSTPVAHEVAMLELNCRAVIELTHHFGNRFVARGRGGLVLFSSLLAFQGAPRASNYAATKAWVQTFAEGLRVELAGTGVEVLACAPGPIRSGFGARAQMQMNLAQGPETVADTTLRALGRRGTVRPGWLSKVLAWALAPLPRWGRVRMMGRIMDGMTRHHA